MAVKVNHKHSIHKGRVFVLERENVTLPNDVTIDIDVIRHPGAAAIVPLTTDGRVVMIRQYRHAVGGYIWEIPAGTLDAGEAPGDCARRELAEETGFRADEWETMGQIVPVPGYSDERIHLFLARHLSPTHQNLDHDEVLNVQPLSWRKALEMIDTGEIIDGKTICALLLADRRI